MSPEPFINGGLVGVVVLFILIVIAPLVAGSTTLVKGIVKSYEKTGEEIAKELKSTNLTLTKLADRQEQTLNLLTLSLLAQHPSLAAAAHEQLQKLMGNIGGSEQHTV